MKDGEPAHHQSEDQNYYQRVTEAVNDVAPQNDDEHERSDDHGTRANSQPTAGDRDADDERDSGDGQQPAFIETGFQQSPYQIACS